jgi:glutamine amidotransferase
MIAIVDYGVGNLFSLNSSFKKVGADTVLASDKRTIENADKIILPGVGAFANAAKKLQESGLGEVVIEQVKKGKSVMGVCIVMQMLFEKSHEYGFHAGLGILKGEVVPMRGYVDDNLKIPHIGWNALHIEKQNQLLKYCKEGDCVYYVHSYYASKCEDSVIATSEYSKPITAAVAKDNVFGCQFHPEKSGEVGLNILRAFCETKD